MLVPRSPHLPDRIALAVRTLKERLAERFGARLRQVVLFGSWAWGDPHADSDVDLCAVIDGLGRADHVAAVGLMADVAEEQGVDLSLLAFATERYARGLADGQLLFCDIEEKGVPL
jgi:predicted nucleotidyltransferase